MECHDAQARILQQLVGMASWADQSHCQGQSHHFLEILERYILQIKVHMVDVLQWNLVLMVGSLHVTSDEIMIFMVPEAWLPIFPVGNFSRMLLDLECT